MNILITSLVLISSLLVRCNKQDQTDPEETGDWVPPIGIPRPSFGIEESYRMYDDSLNRNNKLVYRQNEEGGFYTHYVDNSSPNGTNSDNPFGTKEKPRISLPNAANVLPGSVIEVHGKQYIIDYLIYTVNGTKDLPVFLRGYSKTDKVNFVGGDLYLNCQYFIFENFERTKSGIGIRSFEANEAHHVSIRNCDIHDCESHCVYATCWDNGEPANNIVIYNNKLHPDNFDPNAGAFPEKDVLGVYLYQNSNNIWIVDNEINTASGDAVGGGDNVNYTAKNYYIGRNIMHTCGENAIDLKEVENIVVSQNIMYNFKGWSNGDVGAAAIVHFGRNYSPKNVWFLYNEIYDCSEAAFFVGGEQEYPVYFIGNIIHDISNAEGTARAYRPWRSKEVYFLNNVIYNCDNGVDSRIDGPDVELHMYNNIIANIKEGGSHLYISGPQQLAKSVFKNNLYFQENDRVTFVYDRKIYQELIGDVTDTDIDKGSIIANPLFVNASAGDFRLQEHSPAINSGLDSEIFDRYYSLFGVDIRYDFMGTQRPQNDKWDIGAYEYK